MDKPTYTPITKRHIEKSTSSLAQKISIKNELRKISSETLQNEILRGLSAKQKYISSKFFYDRRGSELFEWITKLPEYYPTKTEKSILKEVGSKLFAPLQKIDLVELGSGDCSKISLVLDAIPLLNLKSLIYRPVDFSASAVNGATQLLNKRYPNLKIEGLVADFTQHLDSLPNGQPRVICFFGSTIGNFTPKQAQNLLSQIADKMKTGDQLIMGVDIVKDIPTIEAAYNDSQRITEAFNKNILNVVNKTIESDFSLINFKHRAFFNQEHERIEMHLVAKNDIAVKSNLSGQVIRMNAGETIHTENSYKYTENKIKELAYNSQLSVKDIFYDKNKWFALVQLVK